jgi:hypothetical protein
MFIHSNQTSKKGHYFEKMCKKTGMKVGKPNKTLNIVNKSCGNPIRNDLNIK